MVAQIDRKFFAARPWKIWPRLVAYTLFEGRPLTTRGRWINPLVFAGYRFWSLVPISPREVRPIFILGTGRSGTTVLGSVLSLHRDVGYLNEPKALWQAALGDDDLIGSYTRKPGRYRMGRGDVTARKRRRLHRFYNAFLGLSGSRRIVDKYPELLFRTDLLDQVFPNARKIILVRHGAETCQSIRDWSAENGQTDDAGTADWWGLNDRKWHLLLRDVIKPDPAFSDLLPSLGYFNTGVDRAALEWIASMREALRLAQADRSGTLLLRYEDLVERPEEIIAGICDFCGLDQDESVLTYATETLAPRPPRTAPPLHSSLRPLFQQTLDDLGY